MNRRRPGRATVIATTAILVLVGLALSFHLRDRRTDGWWEEDTGPFTLLLPPGMHSVAEQGIDSFVGKYTSGTIDLGFDYGMYTNDLSSWPKNGKVERVEVNGRSGKIATLHDPAADFPFEVSGYFPGDGKGSHSLALGLFARCKTSEDALTARAIITSVEIHPEGWKDRTLWQRFRRWLGL